MENSVACARKNWKFAIRTVNTITQTYFSISGQGENMEKERG